MSTITKERAELKAFITGFLSDPAHDSQSANGLTANVFRIALASLEAKSRKLFTCSGCGAEGLDEPLESKCHCNEDGAHWVESVVYTAPPAPVSVPDLKPVGFLFVSDDGAVAYSPAEWPMKGFNLIGQIYGDVNACRAAMLHGSEPVSQPCKLPFEQWLSQQTGTIDVECGCVMTEVFFYWLRVAYEAGNSPVIQDGYVLVPKEITCAMDDAVWEAYHETRCMSDIWEALLAAAPQQEVNK